MDHIKTIFWVKFYILFIITSELGIIEIYLFMQEIIIHINYSFESVKLQSLIYVLKSIVLKFRKSNMLFTI